MDLLDMPSENAVWRMPPESSFRSNTRRKKCLNSLEEHLIAKYIPLLKVVGLPKGGQNGCHGPVVGVPSNIAQVTNSNESDDISDFMNINMCKNLYNT